MVIVMIKYLYEDEECISIRTSTYLYTYPTYPMDHRLMTTRDVIASSGTSVPEIRESLFF